MEHAVGLHEADVDAGRAELVGEHLAGGPQVVVLRGDQQRRGEAGQVGVGGERVAVGRVPAEVVGVHEAGALRSEPERGRHLVQRGRDLGRRGGKDVVQHRVDRDERGRLPLVLVTQPQRRGDRQVAAGAGAADGDPGRVDAELRAVVPQPAGRGHTVVERHRVVHAADGQPVVDADDDRAGPGADLARGPVGLAHVEVAHHEPAAVHPEQRGPVGRPTTPRRRTRGPAPDRAVRRSRGHGWGRRPAAPRWARGTLASGDPSPGRPSPPRSRRCRRAAGSGTRPRRGSASRSARGRDREHRLLRAGDPADDVVAVAAVGGDVGDLAAAVEDDDPVGDLVAEREVVGDDRRSRCPGRPSGGSAPATFLVCS